MPTPKMDDLFSRFYGSSAEEDRPQPKPKPGPEDIPRVDGDQVLSLDDPRIQLMFGQACLNCQTVDDWVDSKVAPHTFELDSPRGKFYLTKNRAECKRLVDAGEVVFSPLEIEQFVKLKKKCLLARADRLERGMEEGPEAINESLIDRIYAIKRIDPGSKLDVMGLELADDVPWVYREEEMKNEQR